MPGIWEKNEIKIWTEDYTAFEWKLLRRRRVSLSYISILAPQAHQSVVKNHPSVADMSAPKVRQIMDSSTAGFFKDAYLKKGAELLKKSHLQKCRVWFGVNEQFIITQFEKFLSLRSAGKGYTDQITLTNLHRTILLVSVTWSLYVIWIMAHVCKYDSNV